jgi:hypothetical protein
MHYVTRRSHWMEKHKFGVKGPDALFIDTARGPHELEKSWIEVSRPKSTEMHYVTRRSH